MTSFNIFLLQLINSDALDNFSNSTPLNTKYQKFLLPRCRKKEFSQGLD